jgi:hypothetical protein
MLNFVAPFILGNFAGPFARAPGSSGPPGWILATGFWVDAGVWDDAATWID